jgi:predicted phage-related endonuclease
MGKIRRNVERRVEDLPIKVHIDAVLQDNGEPIESKTEGLYGPIYEPWGDEGTDEVPEYTCIQDIKLIRLIREQAIHFWEQHVLKDIPPEDCAPRLENIKKIRRVEGDPVQLDNELVDEFIKAREACTRAEKYKSEMQAKVLAKLDGNELGESTDYFITNFRQSKTYLNGKKLAEKHPDIAKIFTKLSSFPVMRAKEKAKV